MTIHNKSKTGILVFLIFGIVGCSDDVRFDSPTKVESDAMGSKISGTESQYFVVNPKSCWGEYGKVLIHGSASLEKRDQGIIRLHRTGPEVPRITMPNRTTILVRDDTKDAIEKAFMNEKLTFKKVIFSKIVRVDWHLWDQETSEVQESPPSGSPISYLLDPPNDVDLSNELTPLWEIELPRLHIKEIVELRQAKTNKTDLPIRKNESIFVTSFSDKILLSNSFVVVTKEARDKFRKLGIRWLEFKKLEEHRQSLESFQKNIGQ